jgi:hypothetical protein
LATSIVITDAIIPAAIAAMTTAMITYFAHEFTLSFQIHIRLCGYYWLNYLKNGNIITTYSFCAGALAVTLETGQAFANHGSHSSDGTDNGGQWRQ